MFNLDKAKCKRPTLKINDMNLDKVFQNNKQWIKDKLAVDNDYFEELGKG